VKGVQIWKSDFNLTNQEPDFRFHDKIWWILIQEDTKNFEPWTFINQRQSARHRRGCLASPLQI